MGRVANLKKSWRWLRAPERRWAWYLAAGLLYGAIQFLPIGGLSKEARGALAVFAVAGFLWGTNSLPLAVTGVLVLFLLPVSGALSAEEVYAYFGSDAVFFILGALILASPVMRSGLSARLALLAVRRFGERPRAMVAVLLVTPALMAFFISEHAVVAMLFPLVLELARASGARPGEKLGMVYLLALAWGAIVGGIATLLGGARAPLALGMLQASTGSGIGFLSWLWATAPLVLGLLATALAVLWRLLSEDAALDGLLAHLNARVRDLGSFSYREWKVLGLWLMVVGMWIFLGEAWGLGTVALLGVVLAFVLGVADWREVEEDVNWGVFLMYGSAIALASALQATGAAAFLASTLFGGIHAKASALAAILILSLLLTEVMSNAAAVAVLMPVALAASSALGLSPQVATLGVAVSAGLAFLLPVSTPAIAIVVSSGYVRPLQAFRYGLWLKGIGLLLLLVVAWIYWPWIGFGG